MKYMKYILPLVLLVLSNFTLASEARSYNLVPSNLSVIDSQWSTITQNQTTKSGMVIKGTQDSVYIRGLQYYNSFGNLGAMYALVPYNSNKLEITKPISVTQTANGVGDIKLLMAQGLYNMPALTYNEYISFDKTGIHSTCSVAVTIPANNYDQSKLINAGSNRQTIKPECALSYNNNIFQVDWFTGFTHYSNDINKTVTKSQNKLIHNELHFSINVTPKHWFSFDLMHSYDGQTYTNNKSNEDFQNNLIGGLLINYKATKSINTKLTLQKTVTSSKYSAKMTGIGITTQLIW